jgi:hypothetical protein
MNPAAVQAKEKRKANYRFLTPAFARRQLPVFDALEMNSEFRIQNEDEMSRPAVD